MIALSPELRKLLIVLKIPAIITSITTSQLSFDIIEQWPPTTTMIDTEPKERGLSRQDSLQLATLAWAVGVNLSKHMLDSKLRGYCRWGPLWLLLYWRTQCMLKITSVLSSQLIHYSSHGLEYKRSILEQWIKRVTTWLSVGVRIAMLSPPCFGTSNTWSNKRYGTGD